MNIKNPFKVANRIVFEGPEAMRGRRPPGAHAAPAAPEAPAQRARRGSAAGVAAAAEASRISAQAQATAAAAAISAASWAADARAARADEPAEADEARMDRGRGAQQGVAPPLTPPLSPVAAVTEQARSGHHGEGCSAGGGGPAARSDHLLDGQGRKPQYRARMGMPKSADSDVSGISGVEALSPHAALCARSRAPLRHGST